MNQLFASRRTALPLPRRPAFQYALLSLALIAVTTQAAAQDTPAAAATAPSVIVASANSDNAVSIQTVTVTAQKRAENIQDVPISITALRGSDIEAQHITSFDDLSRAVPGVSFNSLGASEGLTNVVIRGVSSTSGSATVGTYIDNVSITVKNFYDGSADPRLVDLDRIEVLRGPQGTLFGDSSEGGTIRYITQAPDMHSYSASVTVQPSYTEHGGANFFGSSVVNAPVVPGVFALRGSIGYTSDSGFIDHYSQSGSLEKRGVNADRTFVAHLVGNITPGDGLTITPAFFYQRANSDDNAAFYPALGLWKQDKQVPEPGQDILTLGSLTLQKTLGFADLTEVIGIFQRDFQRQEDGTFYNSTTFATAFLDPLYPQNQQQNDSIIGNLPSPVKFDTNYHQYSSELRLSSPAGDAGRSPWKWVTGLYLAQQRIHNTNFQQIPGINTAFQQIYGMPMEQSQVETAYGAPGLTLFPNDIDESDNRTYNERQYAVFGQVDYDLRPDWHFGLGARYAVALENFTSTEIGFFQIGNINPYNQSARFNAFNPKATLSHDLTPDNSIYASAGKGFRLGGPTGPIVFGPTSVCASDFANINQTTQPTKFGSDSLWTYELGSKNLIDDKHVTLNAAAFYTNWKNIQQQIYLPTCGYYFTANVGNARVYGGELESAYKVTRDFKLTFSGSYEEATITQTSNPLTVAQGAHLIDVPRATYNLGAIYRIMLSEDYYSTLRANYAWTGNSHGSYQTSNSNYSNPPYGVLNLNLGLSHSIFEFSLFAKNALNNRTIIQQPEINTVFEGYTATPQTVGLTASAQF